MPRKKTCSAFDNTPTFSVHAVWPKIECLRLGSRCRKKRNCSRALVSSSSAKLFLCLKNAAFRKGVRPCRTLLSPISSEESRKLQCAPVHTHPRGVEQGRTADRLCCLSRFRFSFPSRVFVSFSDSPLPSSFLYSLASLRRLE
ncbi:hypothetical protein TGRH88_026280 [Toxoplasma gondii]|uniref:Uncharacterized protein n=1 Tax=Toxoplasma gondii TaxID=5811 RepID=A0A7J6KAT4_TOXGO|nr:hypothetical protein TGRH88_026280 [Toxoplasma gondii]